MPALLLLAPLLHLLRTHGYPLLRLEILLVVSGTTVIGLALGLAIHRARPALRLALVMLVLTLAWDLWFAEGSLPWAVISAGTIFLLVLALRAHITTIALAIALALMASTLLPPATPVRTTLDRWDVAGRDTGLPPVFHFVLDEHAGMAGLAGDQALVGEVTAWYATRGFRLFPNAYSPYFDTYNSLPNLVNFTTKRLDAGQLQPIEGRRPELRANRYFELMHERGYAMRVYQPDYMDMCSTRTRRGLRSCLTYPANSLAHAAGLPMSSPARARLVASYVLVNRAWLLERALAGYRRGIRPVLGAAGVRAPMLDWTADHVNAPVADVHDAVRRDMQEGTGGTVYFVHLLMPHYPYQYDAQCRPLERVRDRLDRGSPNAPRGVDNTPESRARRLELYGDQVRCLMRQMHGFLAELDSLGLYDRSAIIMQGDHGSRIVIRRPEGGEGVGTLTRQDLLDGFSALFAVKAPQIAPGADTTTAALGELLERLVASRFASATPSRTDGRTPVVWIVNRPRSRMIPLTYPDPRLAQSERMLRNVIE